MNGKLNGKKFVRLLRRLLYRSEQEALQLLTVLIDDRVAAQPAAPAVRTIRRRSP